jgi:DNA (cytosine-5)-methyltransferase 1
VTGNPRIAEFFAGIGLVRMGLEQAGCKVVFANDIDSSKHAMYSENFDASCFKLCDIREIQGTGLPDVEIASASFPCTDVSEAGNRGGLAGAESGLVWEFLRVLSEMADRRPQVVLIENVVGLATSNGGTDLRAIIKTLNRIGYVCDILVIDAKHFVPQSRPRLFVVGQRTRVALDAWHLHEARPKWIRDFALRFPDLELQAVKLPALPEYGGRLDSVVEHVPLDSGNWWEGPRLEAFRSSLSDVQANRLQKLVNSSALHWASAYRRTRKNKPVWEIRSDDIAGCLRTARGGSSKQAIVEAGRGNVRVRWMTAREYARLQGAPNLDFGNASESQTKFALGDAVCVPAIEWLARHYLVPAVKSRLPGAPLKPVSAYD